LDKLKAFAFVQAKIVHNCFNKTVASENSRAFNLLLKAEKFVFSLT